MNKRYTSWIPLKGFYFDGQSYLVMMRINKKTGMIYFKQKKLTSTHSYHYIGPEFNADTQFSYLGHLASETTISCDPQIKIILPE